MKSRAYLACTIALTALGGIACSSPEKDNPKLLDSKTDTPTEEQAAEDERMRKMQLIRVIDTSTDPEEVRDIDPDSFAFRVAACDSEQFCSQQGADACGLLTCLTRRELCLSEVLLAIASGTGTALEFEITVPGSANMPVRVPAQSAATNAALAMSSAQRAENALGFATRTLNSECPELEAPTEFTGGANAQAFSTASFLDAFDSGKRAYRVAYKNTLAVSDAELSSSNQLEVARIRAIAKEDLSRTAAAHLMIGGQPGWFGSTREAFCTEGRLTGPEQAALSVLREAALSPADVITEEITADAMVNGTTTGGQAHFGTVRQRLQDVWGSGAFPGNRPLWDAYGLKEADFQAALDALREEVRLFGRSFTAKLTPRELPGSQTPDFDRYAGTASKPPDRPDEYWALLALFDAPEAEAQSGMWRDGNGSDIYQDSFGLPIGGADNLAGFVERAYSWAGLIAFNPAFDDAASEVQNPLKLLLGGEDTRGRFMHCAIDAVPPETPTTRLRVAGFEAADKLVLVRGQDLMDCAVEGHIEGAPCVLPNLLNLPSPDVTFNNEMIPIRTEEPTAVGPFYSQVTATWTNGHIPNGRYYLIRPRQKGDQNAGPGEWELILGVPMFDRFQGGHFCRDIPIVPEAIEGAARAIAPSRDWCGQSEVSCAGVRFDERLPLEDELSTDQDDIESSWKHYLDLARRAVDHADALGEEFVRAALDRDLREEDIEIRRMQREEQAIGEFQRVQEICGVAVDPNVILELFGRDANGDLDLSNAAAGNCVSNDQGPPVCGLRRLALERGDEELGALADCLGSFGGFQETHLGNGFLCAADAGTDLDENNDGEEDKPRVRVVRQCDDTSGGGVPDDVGQDEGCDAGYHCIPSDDGLSMFDTQSLVPDPPLPVACDGIRLLRTTPVHPRSGDGPPDLLAERQRLYDAITKSPLFGPEGPALSSVTSLGFLEGPTVGIVLNRFPFTPQQCCVEGFAQSCSLSGVPRCTDPQAPNRCCPGSCQGVPTCTPLPPSEFTFQVSSSPGSILCGAQTLPCPEGADQFSRDGLICRRWNCDDPEDRAELNLRLYKAGAALGGTIPTVWYLNHYVQPLRLGQGLEGARQWVLFDARGGRIPEFQDRSAPIMVPQGTTTAVAMGPTSQWWTMLGPKPRKGDADTSAQIVHTNNKEMQLALRLGTANRLERPFNYLDVPPATTDGGSVTIVLSHLGHGSEFVVGAGGEFDRSGLGAVEGCLRDPNQGQGPSGTLDDGACDLNYWKPAFNPTTGVPPGPHLKRQLQEIGLEYYSSTGLDPEDDDNLLPEVAPATSRLAGQAHTVFGKQVFPPPPGGTGKNTIYAVDVQARLDALELACEALGGSGQSLDEGCGDVPPVTRIADFERIGRHLECLGNEITRRASTSVYKLPEGAIEFLKNGERVYDATGGSLAVGISGLRNSLLEASTSAPIIGGTLRRFGQDLRGVRAQLERIETLDEINDLQLEATIANQVTNCLTAAADAFDAETLIDWGAPAAALATCGNTIAQIVIATKINALEDKVKALDMDIVISDFAGRSSDYVQTLEIQGIRLSQALEGIQGNLEVIEGQKAEAQRAVNSALWLLSRQAFNQQEISGVLDGLATGKYIRYQRAFEDAQKMAFFAKRSIEMRLGMSLSDMVYDLPLVTAPSSWEATVCQSTGIDYLALRSTGQSETTFADAFLGDYVTKLEQVVESYRVVNNFHEGSDTTIVSLRDDIFNTRATCDVDSPNLLYWASNLEPRIFAPDDTNRFGWTLKGCRTVTILTELGDVEQPDGNCIVPRLLDDSPFFDPLVGRFPVAAWNVEFGDPEWCVDESCAYLNGAALSQNVELEPGRYRLSWYTTDGQGAGGFNAARVRHADGTEFPIVAPLNAGGMPIRGFVPAISPDWNRVYFEFDVSDAETVTVGFERPSEMDTIVPLAAPMLEKLEDAFHSRTSAEPPGFSDTADVRREFLPVCEDTTGLNFRTQKWDRNCLMLCPDGYSSDCTEGARTECFWETSFNVHQRSIEAGHMFNQSGFARGNFNYRIKSMGLNFVGTDLRACEDSSLPTTCNAAGFIPYSILHAGPYYVRNHMGQDYRLALFPGRIEHARGLGIERYVTNPMSDADQKLLAPYMRTELSGRPLDGEFIIRVWDEPGVNFAAIQDVQLVIDYGYWTRFN